MTGYVLASLIFAGGITTAVAGELVNEEIRGWLDYLPRLILQLAARRLEPAGKTAVYEDEWLPELTYILRGAEARPLSRLVIGVRFSIGLLVTARRIARHLHRTPLNPVQAGLPQLASEFAAGIASERSQIKLMRGRFEEVLMTRTSLAAEITEMKRTGDILHVVALHTACRAIAPEYGSSTGTPLDLTTYQAGLDSFYHDLSVTERDLDILYHDLAVFEGKLCSLEEQAQLLGNGSTAP